MIYRPVAILMFLTAFSAGLVLGQQAGKRDTDRDDRELKGPVRSLKIATEVIETVNKDDAGDGWKPSERALLHKSAWLNGCK